ncbi:hypothetical protein ACFL1K_05275 [Candidatus Omnitrophota bacterium]
MEFNLQQIQTWSNPHIEQLQNFQFSIFNPLFWVSLLAMFLITWKFWRAKRSFSFSLVVGVILLASTEIERMVAKAVASSGGVLDPFLIRALFVCLIFIVSLYYIFVKSDT